MAADALLFDLDGTLCDSRPWYVAMLTKHGAEPRVVAARLAAHVSIVALARELNISLNRFAATCREGIAELELYPWVHETLLHLNAQGKPLGLVTSLARTLADVVLEGKGLQPYFGAVVTPLRGMPAKPHPASLLRGLEQLELRAHPDIYYVGDRAPDAAAATAAGISFAWASYGYGDDAPPGTAVVLTSFQEVVRL